MEKLWINMSASLKIFLAYLLEVREVAIIEDLFSREQKRLRGELPELFVYDQIPGELRVQIVFIVADLLGTENEYHNHPSAKKAYEILVRALRKEYGRQTLVRLRNAIDYYPDELKEFIISESNIDRVIDVVQMALRLCAGLAESHDLFFLNRRNTLVGAELELTQRFRGAGIGYEFRDGSILRVDSALMHAEAIRPALTLLRQKGFTGAEDEYLKAHEHHRHGRNKEALAEALKAFESVMKTICGKRGWAYDPAATSKVLIKACLDNGLVPAHAQEHLTALRMLLESSVPTLRNKSSGHGQGAVPQELPEHVAVYGLHMAGAAIIFLTESDAALG